MAAAAMKVSKSYASRCFVGHARRGSARGSRSMFASPFMKARISRYVTRSFSRLMRSRTVATTSAAIAGRNAAAAAFLPAIAALVVATVLERIKRENDLVTYREILAFMNGEANIERDPRALPRRAWPTKHRLAYDLLTFIAAAAIGGALGFAVWGLLN